MAKAPSRANAPTHDSVRLEALLASIGEGIIATDETGAITRVNQAALDLLGVRRSRIMHRHFLQAVTAVHDNGSPVDPIERPIVKAFQTGKTVHARMLYQRYDGSLLPVHVTVSPIIYNRRPVGAIEVFRDLTAEIENDKLKSDFISIASHQLRTPLSAINMYTRMLQGGMAGELSEAQQPYVDAVLQSVERMNALIDTLLNITRIEAGGISIKIQTVHPEVLSQEMLSEFIPSAQEKSITLTHDIPSHVTPLRTDGLLVKEVCANLLSNALKYTPKGGTVHFELSETEAEVRWMVHDTGYGIPAGEQKNIFLKFFRAENITQKDVSGTGLGLYLIKNIVESLGGELWFDSVENQGSTFYFSLPKRSSR